MIKMMDSIFIENRTVVFENDEVILSTSSLGLTLDLKHPRNTFYIGWDAVGDLYNFAHDDTNGSVSLPLMLNNTNVRVDIDLITDQVVINGIIINVGDTVNKELIKQMFDEAKIGISQFTAQEKAWY